MGMLTPWTNAILGYLEAFALVDAAPLLSQPVEPGSRILGAEVGGDIGSPRASVALLLSSRLLRRNSPSRLGLLVTALGIPLTSPSIL